MKFQVTANAHVFCGAEVEVPDNSTDGERANLMAKAIDDAFKQVRTQDISRVEINIIKIIP